MALNNTSDRYKYIYGTEAPKLERYPEEHRPKQKKKQVKPVTQVKTVKKVKKKKQTKVLSKSEQQVRQNQRRFYAVDRGFVMVLLTAAIMVSVASFGYVSKSAQLSGMVRKVKQLKNQKNELMNKQATLQSEIDNSLNLEEVAVYAQENLNLTYPAESRILYYQKSADDYFRQYGNVKTDE